MESAARSRRWQIGRQLLTGNANIVTIQSCHVSIIREVEVMPGPGLGLGSEVRAVSYVPPGLGVP